MFLQESPTHDSRLHKDRAGLQPFTKTNKVDVRLISLCEGTV